MNIYITGGTGLIGQPLCQYLLNCGHQVWVLTRSESKAKLRLPQQVGIITTDYQDISLEQLPKSGVDAVINLAGDKIDQRWSAEIKKKLTNSRIQPTQFLINWFKTLHTPPKVLISGSAIGYYGSSGENLGRFYDESSDYHPGFTHDLCEQWEQAAQLAAPLGVRVVLLRTGIVLSKQGGALAKMLPPFKMGLGGKMGSGKQSMSWIHLLDLLRVIEFCLNSNSIQGPVNATAPEPVNNKTFSAELSKVLNRPNFFSVPSAILTLLFGEMGEELLLKGECVIPKKLNEAGFEFKFKTISAAFKDIFS